MLFLSTFTNNIDPKGRVSVPGGFRSCALSEQFQGVVLYRSFTADCIEGVTMSRLEKIALAADNLDIFGKELDDLSALLFADARPLQFDVAGRIVIPAELLKHANIKDTALFVGRGNSFQIWNPEKFKQSLSKSLATLQKSRPEFKIV